jgi:FkbM family methyltransferase
MSSLPTRILHTQSAGSLQNGSGRERIAIPGEVRGRRLGSRSDRIDDAVLRRPFSPWWYYLSSLPTLLKGVKRPVRVALACSWSRRSPLVIELGDGSRFRVRDAMDVWIVKETCLDRQYEQRGISIEPDWTVVDVGAGIGYFTVRAARRCPSGRVIALEPSADNFALLERNVQLNRLDNVTAIPAALAARPGEVALEKGNHPVQHRTVEVRGDTGVSAQAPALTLQALFRDHEIDRCDLLKLDCEGCEVALLSGPNSDALARVQNVSLEFHGRRTGESIGDHLRRSGFTVSAVPSPVLKNTGLLFGVRR